MRKQLFLVLIFSAFFCEIKAQTSRPGVLVIGNSNTAAAAALQSAISGVQTTILLQAGGFDIVPVGDELSSGLQSEFLKKYNGEQKGSQPIVFDKQKANKILSAWADSTKNLTVVRNIMWVKADRSGNNWAFKLSDGSTIKPKVLINPADAKLNEALKITVVQANPWKKLDYQNTTYRTSVAAGGSNNRINSNFFSLYQFFVQGEENLVWAGDPSSMLIGQAAGATAAYAAFFKLKTSESNLKKIQGELINYKLDLMPFADIRQPDSNWKAIQFVGLTGVLKAEVNSGTAKFSPDKLVTTEEIRQPIKDMYYKAQIWFDDYKSPIMTIGSTLDMIAYVGNKSIENTKQDLEKNWKKNYHFSTSIDLSRQITRREMAVLLQNYMPPFNVNVDKEGKVVR